MISPVSAADYKNGAHATREPRFVLARDLQALVRCCALQNNTEARCASFEVAQGVFLRGITPARRASEEFGATRKVFPRWRFGLVCLRH